MQPIEYNLVPMSQPGLSNCTSAMVEMAVSSSATPDEPSFLNLPAELRNLVYSFLFKNEKRTLLHNARAWPYSDVLCNEDDSDDEDEEDENEDNNDHESREGYEDDEDDENDENDEDYEDDNFSPAYWDEGEDHAFVHHFEDALPFLRTCRQIHQEASGIFYGDNSFVISQVPVVDANDRKRRVCVPEAYQPLVYAQEWLTSLGSQVRFLRQVCIDVGVENFAVTSLRDCYDEFDLLPIARLLWSTPQATLRINFEQHVGRSVDNPIDDTTDDTNASRESEEDRALVGHDLFQTLVKDDVLSLKRYAYSRHLIEKITVLPICRRGIVEFKNGYQHSPEMRFPPGLDVYKRFLMVRDGRVQGFEPRIPSTSVMDLYPDLTDRIFDAILRVSEPIILNIDKHTCTNLPKNIFHINLLRRRMAIDNTRWIETNTFIVWATSTTSSTDFGGFRTMQKVRRLPAFESLFERVTTLELTFNLSEPTTLTDICINVRDLLPQITALKNTRIDIILHDGSADKTHEEKAAPR